MTTNTITATEAAKLVGRTRTTIHRWVAEGRLTPVTRLGAQGFSLFNVEDVLDASHRRSDIVRDVMTQPIPSDTTDPAQEEAEDAFLELFPDFLRGWRREPNLATTRTSARYAAWIAGRNSAVGA